METHVVVLLRLQREGALFMKSDGKSRINIGVLLGPGRLSQLL